MPVVVTQQRHLGLPAENLSLASAGAAQHQAPWQAEAVPAHAASPASVWDPCLWLAVGEGK